MSEGDNHGPLQQFEIKYLTEVNDIFGLNLNFSNSSLFMMIVVAFVTFFLSYSIRKKALVPGRLQSVAEVFYEMVASMLKENVGNEGRKYFPFIFTLFMFILGCNLTGMLPYSFTVTSHVAVTFALAAFIFVSVTLIAIVRHGTKFFKFFLPDGVPTIMAPLMVFIELFAYLARPVSLSVRLSANMLAGHVMLKVIAGFVIPLGIAFWGIGGALPVAFLVVLTGFEIFVAVLQAYIFTVLTCVYLSDAVHLH